MDDAIRAFYDEAYDEAARLTISPHGRLELLRTRELLRRFLPPAPARVLDVGGGPGTHAAWLADDGYEVHVIDPIQSHLESATRRHPGVTAVLGDARHLDYEDGWADVVLVLGPLYHLVDPADRLTALGEAARTVRAGGLVAAAAVNRYASLLDAASKGRLNDESEAWVRRTIHTGVHDPRLGFTSAYFHTTTELSNEMTAAGLDRVAVFGVEGPMAPVLDAYGLERFAEFVEGALICARTVERDPALAGASPHLLGVGWCTLSN